MMNVHGMLEISTEAKLKIYYVGNEMEHSLFGKAASRVAMPVLLCMYSNIYHFFSNVLNTLIPSL